MVRYKVIVAEPIGADAIDKCDQDGLSLLLKDAVLIYLDSDGAGIFGVSYLLRLAFDVLGIGCFTILRFTKNTYHTPYNQSCYAVYGFCILSFGCFCSGGTHFHQLLLCSDTSI